MIAALGIYCPLTKTTVNVKLDAKLLVITDLVTITLCKFYADIAGVIAVLAMLPESLRLFEESNELITKYYEGNTLTK